MHKKPLQGPFELDKGMSLYDALVCSNPETRWIAAAMVRASAEARDVARRTSTWVVTVVDGEVCRLHPDSPLLPDLTELLELADRVAREQASNS
jgi:hypothetical protein